MRLTLRTLLAYLDDTLQPAESRDIGQQIAQEPAIQELVTRIRNVMRRRRLLADSPDPDHAEVDPNDVAEYLDSVLNSARINDLEKRILEHDSDLAEAASVHQILSLVLGKPSEVPARSKERAYKLVRSSARSHVELEPIGPARGRSEAERKEIPRPGPQTDLGEAAPSNGFGSGVLAASLAALLAFAVYYTVTGQKERPLPPIAREAAAPDAQVASASPKPNAAPLEAAQEENLPAARPAQDPNPPQETAPPTPPPPEPIPPPTTSNGPSPLPDPIVPSERSAPSADAGAPPVESAKEAGSLPPEPVIPPDELDDVPEVDRVKVPPPARREEPPTPEVAKVTPSEQTAPPAEKPAARVVPVATYASETGILFRKSGETWSRLAPQKEIQSGDVIAFGEPGVCKIKLPIGTTLYLMGPTRIVPQFDPSVDFSFDFQQGRLVIEAGSEPAHLRVLMGNAGGTLTLNEQGQKVAIERQLVPPDPADSSQTESVHQIDLRAVQGTIEWEANGEKLSLTPGERLLARSDGPEAGTLEQADGYSWVNSTVDSATAKVLGKLSDEVPMNDKSVEKLREIIENTTNKELRSLALDAIAIMGHVPTLCEGLRQPQQELVRQKSFQTLRLLCLEGPDPRREVKASLTQIYGRANADLLDSLLSSPRVTKSSGRNTLLTWLDYLDAEELAVREAALGRLMELAGRNVGYSAEAPSSQRKTAISKWRKWIESEADSTR